MIWLLLVLVFLVGAGFFYWSERPGVWHSDGLFSVGVLLVLPAVVVAIVVGVLTATNIGAVSELTAFHGYNAINLEAAVEETASYLSSENPTADDVRLIDGSIEKLRQAGYVSERIAELVAATNNYNRQLAAMQRWNKNLLFGIVIPDDVELLKLITIE